MMVAGPLKSKSLLLLTAIILTFNIANCTLPLREYTYSESYDLSRDYEWYKTQMDTGPESGNNCGPTTVAMAIKYVQNRDVSVADLRSASSNKQGWWYPNDIKKALISNGINNSVRSLESKDQLMASLSQGHLIIACLNMRLISETFTDPDSRYNKFYDGVTGHFIILKGYEQDQQWFLVYDPNNWSSDYYSDKSPKGKDRLYDIDEVYRSMITWWDAYFEIM